MYVSFSILEMCSALNVNKYRNPYVQHIRGMMVASEFLKSIYLSFLLQAHRKHAKFLNKRIEMYDELAIVVGKDMAIDSFAKSYVDLDLKQENIDNTENVADIGEDGAVDKGKNVVESSTIGSTILKSHKRSHAPLSDDNIFIDLSEQLRKLLWP